MEKYIPTLIENVNNGLHNIHLEENDICIKASQTVNLLENVFGRLKYYISSYSFENEDILSFKRAAIITPTADILPYYLYLFLCTL